MSIAVFQNQPAIHIVTVNLTQSTEEIWAISRPACPPGQFLERCHATVPQMTPQLGVPEPSYGRVTPIGVTLWEK